MSSANNSEAFYDNVILQDNDADDATGKKDNKRMSSSSNNQKSNNSNLNDESKFRRMLCCCRKNTQHRHQSSIMSLEWLGFGGAGDDDGAVGGTGRRSSTTHLNNRDEMHPLSQSYISVIDEESRAAIKKLKFALADKWIDCRNLGKLMDDNKDGFFSYDDFYDIMSQVGLVDEFDLDRIFSIIDEDGTGNASVKDFCGIMKLAEEEIRQQWKLQEDFEAPPFPGSFMIAIIADSNMKASMVKFVTDNFTLFRQTSLVSTGSVGRTLDSLGLDIENLVNSGQLGGIQEISGMVAQAEVGAVFYFQDPLSTTQSHNHDVRALRRICCVHNCLFACNPGTAQALVYSLEFSAFGHTHMIRRISPPPQSRNSKVLSVQSDFNDDITSRPDTTFELQKRASLILRGSKNQRRSSLINALERMKVNDESDSVVLELEIKK